MKNPYVGRTVALTRCPARVEVKDDQWEEAEISGLWLVEEFDAEDREAGLFGEWFVLSRKAAHTVSAEIEEGCWDIKTTQVSHLLATVDSVKLIRQIDPKAFMAEMQAEDEMSWLAETRDDAQDHNWCDPVFGHPQDGVRLVNKIPSGAVR